MRPPAATFEDAMEEYEAEQRRNGYYVLVSVLFALILGQLVVWLHGTLSEAFPPSGPAEVVRLCETVRVANATVSSDEEGGVDFKGVLEKAELVPVKGKSMLVTLVPTAGADRLWWLLPRIGLILAFLYLTIILWMYFSRLLVYHAESLRGEAWTLILGFTVLCVIALTSLNPENWMWGGVICLVVVAIKNHLVHADLARLDNDLTARFHGIGSQPLTKASRWWRILVIIYAIALPVIGFPLIYAINYVAGLRVTVENLDQPVMSFGGPGQAVAPVVGALLLFVVWVWTGYNRKVAEMAQETRSYARRFYLQAGTLPFTFLPGLPPVQVEASGEHPEAEEDG